MAAERIVRNLREVFRVFPKVSSDRLRTSLWSGAATEIDAIAAG